MEILFLLLKPGRSGLPVSQRQSVLEQGIDVEKPGIH